MIHCNNTRTHTYGFISFILNIHQAGATSSVKPTLDVLSLPRSLWGKISTDVAGWSLSSRVGLNLVDDNNAAIDLAASNDDLDTSIKVGESILSNKSVRKFYSNSNKMYTQQSFTFLLYMIKAN